MKTDIKKAFINPMRDRAWLIKVIIGGFISSIPIINVIIANGYIIIYLTSLLKSDNHNLPRWTDIGVLLIISMKLILVCMVYFSPLIAFQFIVDRYYPLNVTEMGTSLKMRMIINLPIILLIKFLLNVAYVKFAQNNFKISAAINIKEVFSLLKTHIKEYSVVYMYDVITFLILTVLELSIFIGKSGWAFVFAQFLIGTFLFYAYLVINNMLAMVFSEEEWGSNL